MMEMFTEESFLRIESLVRECGKIMLSANDIEADTSNIKKKSGDADFVTVFDESVQKALIEGILCVFPEAKFFAEEKDNFAEDTKEGICFVIDPIDGTTNFIHSLGASSISVAMLYNGEIVYSVVYDPYREELFSAIKGKGANLNGKKISVSDREMENAVISFGTTPYKKEQYGCKGFSIAHNIFMHCADIRRSGSAAIDMANVACGRTDGFFECILSPWDYAGGTLLIEEAGGIVSDFSGEPVGFSAPGPVVCSNKNVYKKLIALINSK